MVLVTFYSNGNKAEYVLNVCVACAIPHTIVFIQSNRKIEWQWHNIEIVELNGVFRFAIFRHRPK